MADWNTYKRSAPIFVPNEYEEYVFTEPSVIFEGGIYKMWVRGGGFVTEGIIYATSADGINWTRGNGGLYLDNTLGYQQPFVFKNGNEYWMYANYAPPGNYRLRMDLLTSSDGINWIIDTVGVITADQLGAAQIGNIFVWKENDTYHAMLEGLLGNWSSGYGTSPDGKNWTMHGWVSIHNSDHSIVMTLFGGCSVQKVSSDYFLMFHGQTGGGDSSDIWYATTQNLLSLDWLLVEDQPVLSRTLTWENPGSYYSQVADPSTLHVGNRLYIYYESYPSQNFTAEAPGAICLADIPYPYSDMAPPDTYTSVDLFLMSSGVALPMDLLVRQSADFIAAQLKIKN